MTVTTPASKSSSPVEQVTCVIDGIALKVPKGTLVIRAAEQIGIEIPRFCDHPLLDPVAACRMCLVEVEGIPKPQPACAIVISDKMVIKTQLTSEVADSAQRGVMEFLLINHPLDCPICDKGGECPLQNQAMTHGHGESQFDGVKRTFPKPIPVSTQVLLDRERCVSCTRCTRFADQIAGDPFIDLFERGAQQQVNIADGAPFDSYFSGNTVQICPVGALTSTNYRFRSRPFDLVSTPTTCEHCASGCSMRTDFRRDVVMRRLAGDDPEVNDEWNCDKGRFGFEYLDSADRVTTPMIREHGQLRAASWPEAIAYVADRLAESRERTGILTGGRLTLEDAYAYSKFARVALATDSVDFRARNSSDEEAEFIAAAVAGTGLGVTYADLDDAPIVLLVGFEPEEESPIVFLRLRKAVMERGTAVAAISSWASPGLTKTQGTVLAAAPGGEAAVLDALRTQSAALSEPGFQVATALRQSGAIIMVGERLAASVGAMSAAAALAADTGAKVAWVPRRAGERAAADAGLLPGLLPGGRPLSDPSAREAVARAWNIAPDDLPTEAGASITEVLTAITTFAAAQPQPPATGAEGGTEQPAAGDETDVELSPFGALVIGGVEAADMPDPELFLAALGQVDFVLSLETHTSAVTELADVVLPVAVDTERSGSYVDWEGRDRPFAKVLRESSAMADGRVLAIIADELDSSIGYGDSASLRREYEALGAFTGPRSPLPHFAPEVIAAPAAGQALLATWRHLLDLGALQRGEAHLAGTRRASVARMSAATAAGIGAVDGGLVKVSNEYGFIELPLITTDMPDGVVWVPTNSPGSTVNETLRANASSLVSIAVGGTA